MLCLNALENTTGAGRWTYRRVKENATRRGKCRGVHSRLDHILILEAERKQIKNCRCNSPPTTAPTTAP